MTSKDPTPPLLDISRFQSVDHAIAEAGAGLSRYRGFVDKTGTRLDEDQGPVRLFVLSALGRAHGLHSAIMREMEHENVHTVFVLLRAYLELLALTFYVYKTPAYASSLEQSNQDLAQSKKQTRLGYQRIFAGVKDLMPHGYRVYEEFSDIAHFGHIAMWAQWKAIEDDETGDRYMVFSSEWRSSDYALKACASMIELAENFVGAVVTICAERLGDDWAKEALEAT